MIGIFTPFARVISGTAAAEKGSKRQQARGKDRSIFARPRVPFCY